MSRQPRVSELAWALLQHLEDQGAVLAECDDPWCPRFHTVSRGVVCDVVHSMTMNMLAVAGLIKRCRTAKATYTVSDKGHLALLRRRLDKEAGRKLVLEEAMVFDVGHTSTELAAMRASEGSALKTQQPACP